MNGQSGKSGQRCEDEQAFERCGKAITVSCLYACQAPEDYLKKVGWTESTVGGDLCGEPNGY